MNRAETESLLPFSKKNSKDSYPVGEVIVDLKLMMQAL